MPTTVAFAPSARAHVARAVTAALVALASGGAHAAFFQLAENSPAGMGNAFAGGAAIAEDASTVWYNPAGMTRLSGSQFVAGGYYIKPSLKFDRDSASTTPALGGVAISGGDGGDAGEAAFIPNFYYSQVLTQQWSFGIGVNAPFGLATDYDGDWVGRYHADRSEIKTVNVNPSVAYKIDDRLSVGVGINYQKLDAELSQAVDFGSICTASGAGGVCGPPAGNDGKAKVTADDDAWGYNLGLLWQLTADTRLGFAFRSELDYGLSGKFDITAPANVPAPILVGGGLVDSDVKSDVTLPATLSLSGYHQLGDGWAIMGDITRTYWSDLDELRIEFDSTQDDSVVTLKLKDVNRYSLGVAYTSNAWTYRAGIALDKTPSTDAELRTPRLPDEDRTWLAFGAGYRLSDTLSFDVAYTYIKVDDASISKVAGTDPNGEDFFRGNLAGDYEATTQILSGQVNWKF